jgi:hypothetical protein
MLDQRRFKWGFRKSRKFQCGTGGREGPEEELAVAGRVIGPEERIHDRV